MTASTAAPRCPDLAAVVMTFNEAPNIRACLESVRGLCDVYVVDSGSTDGTPEICREHGAKVFTHAYENHARQWAWALGELPLRARWVLALDADFTVSPELADRLARELPHLPEELCAVYVRHLYVFGGSLIRFGGTKQYWMRLIRLGRARPDLSDLVDFRFVADGPVGRWKEAVVEYNRHDDDISVWLRKQDKFALRLAVEEELRRAGKRNWEIKARMWGHSDQRFAWLRDRWLRMPLFFRPVAYFLYRYVLAAGFLDGRGGFLYHALQGFWFRTVVDWKIHELRQAKIPADALAQIADMMLESPSGSVQDLVQRWKARNA